MSGSPEVLIRDVRTLDSPAPHPMGEVEPGREASAPLGVVEPVPLPVRAREGHRPVITPGSRRPPLVDVHSGSISLSNLGMYRVEGGVPTVTSQQPRSGSLARSAKRSRRLRG